MDTVGEALSEQRMRHAMSCLYATMVLSQANTLAIQEGRIGKIREKEMRGNPTAVSCMKDLAKWVDALKTFIEPVDLETSFLFPMKQSAALLQLMRNDMRRSTSVTGLVFAASDPVHDDITGRYLSTVSAIVPSMECAMCIRVEDWDGENKVGWYAFEGVQPIPLVNRMRPTSAFSIKTSKPEESIREMDFLKCSMSDVEVFRKSVAMENFCEVHSRQTQKRHMLGAPITLHGLVSRISANRVSLRGCGNGNESLTAYLSDGVCREFAERQMGRLEGKYVCALVAVWYWSDHDGNEKPEFEAYAIEEVNLDGAVAGDAVGFVRIRGRASVGDIQGMYGHLPESKSLVKKGDQVLFGVGGRDGRNPVHRKFSEGHRRDQERQDKRRRLDPLLSENNAGHWQPRSPDKGDVIRYNDAQHHALHNKERGWRQAGDKKTTWCIVPQFVCTQDEPAGIPTSCCNNRRDHNRNPSWEETGVCMYSRICKVSHGVACNTRGVPSRHGHW